MDVLRWVWVRVLLKGWTRRDAKLMDELRFVKRDSWMSKGVSLRVNAMRRRTHGSIRVSKRRVNSFFFLKECWIHGRVKMSMRRIPSKGISPRGKNIENGAPKGESRWVNQEGEIECFSRLENYSGTHDERRWTEGWVRETVRSEGRDSRVSQTRHFVSRVNEGRFRVTEILGGAWVVLRVDEGRP